MNFLKSMYISNYMMLAMGIMSYGGWMVYQGGEHKTLTLIKAFMNEKQKYSEATLNNGYRHSLNIKGRS